MRAFEGGECRGGANGFITEQEKDADGLGLADDQDEIDLEHRELRHPKRGAFAENDIDVIRSWSGLRGATPDAAMPLCPIRPPSLRSSPERAPFRC
jgi:hypothetical protein